MSNLENKFKEIKDDVVTNLKQISTEEDSKFQIINRILIEVLGWPYSKIKCESEHENGFSDYLVSDNETPSFLVEAKRIGKVNIITADDKDVKYLKLSGSSLKKCQEGIKQATMYAAPNGITLTVLTDGLSWIIFKSFIQGESYLNKEAVVFPSLDAIESNLDLFCELLSRDSVNERRYNSFFDNLHNHRVSLSQDFYPAIKLENIKLSPKSDIAFDLDKVFERYFSAMAGRDDDCPLPLI